MKLSEIQDEAPPPEAGKTIKLSQVGADPAPETSKLGALWEGLKQGVGDVGVGAAQLASRMPTLTSIGAAGRQRAQAGIDSYAREREASYEKSPERTQHPIMAGLGRFGGNVAGSAPLMAIPGGQATLAGRLGAGAAAGAAGGALSPATGKDYWSEKAQQMGLGAAAGGALAGAGSALARPSTPAAQQMMQRGVQLTPGQSMGGQAANLERYLSAFPFVRNLIRGGEERSVDGFNRAAVNQALEPLGIRAPITQKAGHELIEKMTGALDDAYDAALNGTVFYRTPKFDAEINNLRTLAKMMPGDEMRRFEEILAQRLDKRLGPQGNMDGETFKLVEKDLRKATERARGTELGDALMETRRLLRESLMDQNPQQADRLRRANTAYAMFARVRQAAQRRADSEGVFTPMDLLQASRSQDLSAGKGDFARGDALMQALGEVGMRTIGKVRDRTDQTGRIMQDLALALPGAAAAVPYGIARASAPGTAGHALGQGIQALSPATGEEAGKMLERRKDYFEGRGYQLPQ